LPKRISDGTEEQMLKWQDTIDDIIYNLGKEFEQTKIDKESKYIYGKISKKGLNQIIKDSRIERITDDYQDETPYEYLTEDLPRSLRTNGAYFLLIGIFILSLYLIIAGKKEERNINPKRIFGIVSLIGSFAFLGLFLVFSASYCGGTGIAILIFTLPITLMFIVWEFIYSKKYKIKMGTIVGLLYILALIASFFMSMNWGCISLA